MGWWLLEYWFVPDYLQRRAPLRSEHQLLAEAAREHGDLVLAGALGEPVDRALLVWRTDDRSLPEQFAASDPYVREGLVTRWTVRPWTVVVGEGALPL